MKRVYIVRNPKFHSAYAQDAQLAAEINQFGFKIHAPNMNTRKLEDSQTFLSERIYIPETQICNSAKNVGQRKGLCKHEIISVSFFLNILELNN